MARELGTVKTADIDDSGYQMRLHEDDAGFDELVASVRRSGVLVPLLLERRGERYVVVAGHRRYKAAGMAGLVEVPAQIMVDEGGAAWGGAFAENMFRQDLSAMEEGAAVVDCLERGEFTAESLGAALGKSVGWIEDRVAIAAWPGEVAQAVHEGRISVAAARHLVRIGDEVHRDMLLNYACENGATARVTAAWFQAWEAGQVTSSPGDVEPVPGVGAAPPIEPYCPCVVCQRKYKMVEMRYNPVCAECGPLLVEIAREMSGRLEGGSEGGGRLHGSDRI